MITKWKQAKQKLYRITNTNKHSAWTKRQLQDIIVTIAKGRWRGPWFYGVLTIVAPNNWINWADGDRTLHTYGVQLKKIKIRKPNLDKNN